MLQELQAAADRWQKGKATSKIILNRVGCLANNNNNSNNGNQATPRQRRRRNINTNNNNKLSRKSLKQERKSKQRRRKILWREMKHFPYTTNWTTLSKISKRRPICFAASIGRPQSCVLSQVRQKDIRRNSAQAATENWLKKEQEQQEQEQQQKEASFDV